MSAFYQLGEICIKMLGLNVNLRTNLYLHIDDGFFFFSVFGQKVQLNIAKYWYG